MAITTLDGIVAGAQQPRIFAKALTGTLVAGKHMSLFYLAGFPAAATACTAGIGGEVLTSYAGQIPFTNPSSGYTYLTRFEGQSTQLGCLMLCDRLWQNSGLDITSTGEQIFTGAAQIPPRDRDGTNTGNGVFGAVEVSSATGAGTPTLTLKYYDQGNNLTATGGTNIVSTVASSGAGYFYIIGLEAGDTGIQKPYSLTLSATWTSGTIHVVLFRIIAILELTAAHTGNAIDALSSGFPKLYDNSVPFLVFLPNTTTSSNTSGQVCWSQG
jgi:hypothetical protein